MATATKSNAQAYRILIVDDEPDVTELLKYKLEQEGYNCEVLNDPVKFEPLKRQISTKNTK